MIWKEAERKIPRMADHNHMIFYLVKRFAKMGKMGVWQAVSISQPMQRRGCSGGRTHVREFSLPT
jgi:hypothetical protein